MKTTQMLNREFEAIKFIDFNFTESENEEWLRIISKFADFNLYNTKEVYEKAKQFCEKESETGSTVDSSDYITVEDGIPVIYLKFFEKI